MKRIITLFFVSFLIITGFSGCNTGIHSAPPPIPSSFDADLKIVFNESEIKAHMTQTNIGSCVFTVNSPETLRGMIITFENSKCHIEYKGLKFSLDFAKFPETAFGSALVNTFIAMLDETNLEKTKAGENWQYKGECSSGSFLFIQDGKSGAPIYISIPSLDLTIDFSNYKPSAE